MSQTFTTITGANQLGGFPTIFNANLDAIRSQWSGTSAPSSPVVGQPFYNTTTGYITIWNGTSWVDPANASATLITISAEIIAARGSAASLDARLSISMNPDGTLKDTLPVGDWWMDEPDTPTFVDATSFTLPGDKTAIYITRRAVLLTQTSDDYGYVVSSAYVGGTDTTTVVVEDAVVDSGITAVQFGQPPFNEPKLEDEVLRSDTTNTIGSGVGYANTSSTLTWSATPEPTPLNGQVQKLVMTAPTEIQIMSTTGFATVKVTGAFALTFETGTIVRGDTYNTTIAKALVDLHRDGDGDMWAFVTNGD